MLIVEVDFFGLLVNQVILLLLLLLYKV